MIRKTIIADKGLDVHTHLLFEIYRNSLRFSAPAALLNKDFSNAKVSKTAFE